MAVTKPTHGSVILKGDVIQMHTDVRTLTNDIPVDSLGRNGLNKDQLPANLIAYDYLDELTSIELDHTMGRFQQETPGSIVSDWYCHHKTTGTNQWVLNKGGVGYTLPPCKVIAFMNIRVGRCVAHAGAFNNNPLNGANGFHADFSNSWMFLAALGYEDSSEHWNLADSGCVRAVDTNNYDQVGPAVPRATTNFTTQPKAGVQIVEQSMSIWKVIDKSGEAGNWTLAGLFPRFATFEGDQLHSGLTHADAAIADNIIVADPPKWKITHGTLGFFALRS
tara:strand:+ start:29773 stop:30606 length:834 start_codon:yes stop_codon:yes gene_type:complete